LQDLGLRLWGTRGKQNRVEIARGTIEKGRGVNSIRRKSERLEAALRSERAEKPRGGRNGPSLPI